MKSEIVRMILTQTRASKRLISALHRLIGDQVYDIPPSRIADMIVNSQINTEVVNKYVDKWARQELMRIHYGHQDIDDSGATVQ